MPGQEKHWTLLGTSVGPIADGPEIAVGESVEVVPVSSLEELREGLRREIETRRTAALLDEEEARTTGVPLTPAEHRRCIRLRSEADRLEQLLPEER